MDEIAESELTKFIANLTSQEFKIRQFCPFAELWIVKFARSMSCDLASSGFNKFRFGDISYSPEN